MMAENRPGKRSVSPSCAPLLPFPQCFIVKNFKHSAKLENSRNDYPLDSNRDHLLFLLFSHFYSSVHFLLLLLLLDISIGLSKEMLTWCVYVEFPYAGSTLMPFLFS